MTAPASRWKLGLFVVAGAAVGLGGAGFFGARELRRPAHRAFAYFDEALTGLEEGSPVKFRGVTIGVVDRIRVASDQKHLEVQASLYDDYLRDLGLDVERLDGDCPLPENLRAQVVMSWVTGTAFVQVDFFPDPPSGPQRLPFDPPFPRTTLRTVASTAKSLESSAREVLAELPQLTASARELVALLRTELAGARLPELSARLQRLLDVAEQQLVEVRDRGTVAAATDALTELQQAVRRVSGDDAPLAATLREWASLGESLRQELAAAQVGDTARDVRSAAAGVARTGDDVRAELAQLHAALAAVERLAALLERDPGALLHGRAATRSPFVEGSR